MKPVNLQKSRDGRDGRAQTFHIPPPPKGELELAPPNIVLPVVPLLAAPPNMLEPVFVLEPKPEAVGTLDTVGREGRDDVAWRIEAVAREEI